MPSHFYRMVKYQLKMNNARQKLTIIGGGLAGCEAAWQLRSRELKSIYMKCVLAK